MGRMIDRITRNIGIVTFANIAVRALNLLLQAVIARSFAADALGAYATAATISAYFLFFADLGLAPRLVREGAVQPDAIESEYARAMGLKAFLALLTSGLIAVAYFVLPYDAKVRQLCVWFSVGSVIHSISYLSLAVCQAKDKMAFQGIADLTHAILFVGSTVLLYWMGYSFDAVGVTFVGAALFRALLAVFFASRFISIRILFRLHLPTMRAALPYAITSLTSWAFAQIDILILSFIASQFLVGEYASISRLLLTVGVLTGLAGTAVIPTLSEIFVRSSMMAFGQMVGRALRVVTLLGGFTTVIVYAGAREILGLIYGENFEHLAPMLQMGSFYLVFKFVSSTLQIVLTACGRQRIRARALIIGLAATVLLILLLVPHFGILGAAVALVVSEFVLTLGTALGLRDILDKKNILHTLALSLLHVGGATVCAIGVQAITRIPFVAVLVSVAVYCVISVITGEFRRTVLIFRRGESVIGSPSDASSTKNS